MSDTPVPVPPDPAPAPDVPVVPTEEGTQVNPSDQVPNAKYVEHVLDEPYYGWVYNSVHRINLSGQRVFELVDDGSKPTYGTPPDLT